MKKKALRYIGIAFIIIGVCVLSVFAYKKISREIYLQKLLDENIVLEIPSLNIKVPVLEGTDSKSLQVSAGHFEGTGSLGSGNYCLAGHNSTVYAEIFNDLDQIKIGDEIRLIDNNSDRTVYSYTVSEYNIVTPQSTEILKDFGDNRITIISCTDDGKNRQVVVGLKTNNTIKSILQ